MSGLLYRLIATVTGVRAITSAARSAVPSPAQRRTVRCRTNTAATPSRTCGRISAQPCIPKTLLLTTCGHSAAGGLSTVTTPAGSKEPNRKFVQLRPIDFTAAE